MKKRANTNWLGKLIAKALIWVAGKAIESVPVVGPIVRVVTFVNDVAEARKAYLQA